MKNNPSPERIAPSDVASAVQKSVETVSVFDIHTHLFSPPFGDLLLAGIDELLVYHYLVAEGFRFSDWNYEEFWKLAKGKQADLIWDALFVRHSPVSEACRGVLTTLNRLGLDVSKRDLPALRKWFAAWDASDYISHCMKVAGVRNICMTNSPFEEAERRVWEKGCEEDPRFTSALRIDMLLLDWPLASRHLSVMGYGVSAEIDGKSISEVRRFLADWTDRTRAAYIMVSLPPTFALPAKTEGARLIEQAVLPFCRARGLPFAVMMGARRAINPELLLAGDGVGRVNLDSLQHLCVNFPDNKFLVTVLARENQHELCVLARKFRNLHPFGCWWFLNTPTLIEEMTRMRIELLGPSFTAQHSDARVLDQIVYKWDHSRQVIGKVLAEKYTELAATGWPITQAAIDRDVHDLFGGNFEAFLKG